jgi:hypothetical protein
MAWLVRRSIRTKTTSNTTLATSSPRIGALPQPSSLPRIRAKTRQNNAPVKVTRPAQSMRADGSRSDSGTFARVIAAVAIPIGTFTKKIHSQPMPSVSTPPTSGPTATANPVVAPQSPKAVPRS